jgi:hypothetical protein
MVPLAVYYLVRHHVSGDAVALALAGVPAVTWVVIHWFRQRRIDPIGATVVLGFVVGLILSAALGGNAFVLKVRDSALTSLIGVACLVSLRIGRPVMFYVGRALSAGDDPARYAAYDELWDRPSGPHAFRVMTAVWGVGLICDAGLRLFLASILPTGAFLATSPFASGLIFLCLFGFSLWYSRATRRRDKLGASWQLTLQPAASPTEP